MCFFYTLKNYDGFTVEEVTARLNRMSRADLLNLQAYEEKHRARKMLLDEFERHLNDAGQ
jgi:hypothetical protein